MCDERIIRWRWQASITVRDNEGSNVLHVAAMGGHLEIIEKLISHYQDFIIYITLFIYIYILYGMGSSDRNHPFPNPNPN